MLVVSDILKSLGFKQVGQSQILGSILYQLVIFGVCFLSKNKKLFCKISPERIINPIPAAQKVLV